MKALKLKPRIFKHHAAICKRRCTNLPMTGLLPQLGVVNIGADDFVKASLPVLLFDKVNESVEDDRAFRLEEATSGAQLVEKEQFLILMRECEIKKTRHIKDVSTETLSNPDRDFIINCDAMRTGI